MITALSVNKGGLGRFGNTMFTIASCIGIACKSGQPFGFLPWQTKDNELFGEKADLMSDYFVNPLPALPANMTFKDYGYFWGYRDIKLPQGDWNIDAHMQDPRFFEDYMPLIRHYFRMKNEPAQNDYVAIHYRAGDYIDNEAAYHPRCDFLYYKRAACHFPEDQKYIIFSDNVEKARDKLYHIFSDATVSNLTYLPAFALMKRCKHFITANSSFSLMAAILGEHPEKKIVTPKKWFGKQADGLTFDGYPKNAIVI